MFIASVRLYNYSSERDCGYICTGVNCEHATSRRAQGGCQIGDRGRMDPCEAFIDVENTAGNFKTLLVVGIALWVLTAHATRPQ